MPAILKKPAHSTNLNYELDEKMKKFFLKVTTLEEYFQNKKELNEKSLDAQKAIIAM